MAVTGDCGTQAIDYIREAMRIDDVWCRREARGFTWWGHRLAQRVWADPPRGAAGTSMCRLHARTPLVSGVTPTDEVVAKVVALNGLTTHGPLIWIAEQGAVEFHACAYVMPKTLDWTQRLFLSVVALQAADAHAQAGRLAARLGGEPAWSEHPSSGPRPEPDEMLSVLDTVYAPAGEADSPYGAADFRSVSRLLEKVGWTGHAGDRGFTLEVPIRGEGRPAAALVAAGGGPPETALVVGGNECNPQLGNGLLVRLHLAVDGADTRSLQQLANALNRAETRDWTCSHLVGGWCAFRQDLVFVTFMPAHGYLRGVLDNICVSFGIKARWAAAFVDAERAGAA